MQWKRVGMALALLVASTARGALPPCDAADRLFAEMHYAEAQKAYLANLKNDATQACARNGIEKLAALRGEVVRHVELSRSYSTVDKPLAISEMLAAKSIDPAVEVSAGLTTVAASLNSNPFSAASGLYRRHQNVQALAAFRDAAKANPKASVPDDLQPFNDPFLTARGLSKARFDDQAAAELVTAVKSAPFDDLPPDLEYLRTPWVWTFVRHHQYASGTIFVLTAILVLSMLREKLRPRLHVDDLSDPRGVVVGGGASLLLQQQLVALVRQQPSGVSFVTGPISALTIPAAISSAVPIAFGWLKALLPLLQSISWRRTLTLSGTLHPALETAGVGLTLVLSEDKAIVSTATLWQIEFGTIEVEPTASQLPGPQPASASVTGTPAAPPASPLAGPPLTTLSPAPYFDLIEPAAIWLLFQLLQLKHRGRDNEIWRLIGTNEWKSYALNAAAVRARQVKVRRAEDFLVRAIMIDPANAVARANFGAVLQDLDQPDRAVEQLKFARRDDKWRDDLAEDPVFYSSSYRLASIYYQRGNLPEALSEVEGLTRMMEGARVNAASRAAIDRERVRTYLSFALPVVEVMRVGIEVELGVTSPQSANFQLLDYRLFPSGDVQFNLACTFAILAEKTKLAVERLFFTRDAMKHLKFALHLDPQLGGQAKTDRALSVLRSTKSTEFAALFV
jgi:tetratricopeptide (TPR) repeat protein